MGGLFGVVSRSDCVSDLFFGTDYHSHLGNFAIVTAGVVRNLSALAERAFDTRRLHFSEMGGGGINPAELVAIGLPKERLCTYCWDGVE